jgi:hypothetical protein
MSRHRATVTDCIRWAKDRMIDDYFDFLPTEYNAGPNYAAMDVIQRASLIGQVNKFARLLGLYEEQDEGVLYDNLKELQEAGYWNGDQDTYWEMCDPPLTRPSWVPEDLMPVGE